MKHERNTDGLKENAIKKRDEAKARTDKAIQQLIKDKKKINFNTVAEAADVSKAWLYKEPEIKERIQSLREQCLDEKKLPPQERTSESSWKAKYQTLKDRLQRIEAENRGLRDQLEVAYGRILSVSELEHRVDFLEKENLHLRDELELRQSQSPKSSSPETPNILNLSAKKSVGVINDTIKNELEVLGIPMNSTLQKVIKSVPSETTLRAIATLKVALSRNEVPNMAGFLVAAIKNRWDSNQNYNEKTEIEIFNEWFPLAKSLKLASASMRIEKVLHILTNEEEWIPFSQMLERHPMDALKKLRNIND
ncbi:hypothetical protein H6G06_25460 [Anabaena sphaerica FACHB-251]|uniref:Transposase n=1 Tax=Anabaena sphaerica FACHB-251 TaxID=2692883 RepID=A0A926WLN1_9NOST|nr:DUF6262 family protein [Anabaena sphaerica]MBD2296739.1 hypothetical protein [Anabaena sphaerica FACHB-251]